MLYIVSKWLNHPSKDACNIDLETKPLMHLIYLRSMFGLFGNRYLVQFRPKINRDMNQRKDQFWDPLLVQFWTKFGSIFGAKLGGMLAKIAVILPLVCKLVEITKIFKNHWFLQYIWASRLLNICPKSIKNRSKVDQKSTKKWMKIWMSILPDLGWIFDRFWEGFGSQDGFKIE